MADSSWDNDGYGAPPKSGMPTWVKVMLGCGVAALVLLGACIGGAAWIGQQVKKDPEGFKHKALAFAIAQIRPDWEDFQRVVAQLDTDEGCRALYNANPHLKETYPTEQLFLVAAQGWRPRLEAPPDLTEQVLEGHGAEVHKGITGQVTVGFRTSKGTRIEAVWNGPKISPGGEGRQLISLQVR